MTNRKSYVGFSKEGFFSDLNRSTPLQPRAWDKSYFHIYDLHAQTVWPTAIKFGQSQQGDKFTSTQGLDICGQCSEVQMFAISTVPKGFTCGPTSATCDKIM